ncbi:hypothetical protein Y032_0002g853 [Ancylostoma ceylanicum]|uniref:Uncharacterized protein n=1 Tax=Ancylostoma ceylanicum TaxID=53326 RepID=A0A016W166_9BILA|nr:hypothetical protein Y032_0002g853 [Ancylostoma ceylanicum]
MHLFTRQIFRRWWEEKCPSQARMPGAVFWPRETWHLSARNLTNLWVECDDRIESPTQQKKMSTMRSFPPKRIEKLGKLNNTSRTSRNSEYSPGKQVLFKKCVSFHQLQKVCKTKRETDFVKKSAGKKGHYNRLYCVSPRLVTGVYHHEGKRSEPGDSDWRIRAATTPICWNSNGVNLSYLYLAPYAPYESNRWARRAVRMRQLKSFGYTPFSLMMIHTHL